MYIQGQLYQIAEEIYNIGLQIKVLEEGTAAAGSKNVFVKFRLEFDNNEYMASKSEKQTYLERIPLPDFQCFLLLKLFPFGVIFGEDMKIIGAGENLILLWGSKNVLGKDITEYFRLRRPQGIPFTWKNVSDFVFLSQS